jgi:hypothetical protein
MLGTSDSDSERFGENFSDPDEGTGAEDVARDHCRAVLG